MTCVALITDRNLTERRKNCGGMACSLGGSDDPDFGTEDDLFVVYLLTSIAQIAYHRIVAQSVNNGLLRTWKEPEVTKFEALSRLMMP
jgi:hypothetical protein